MRDGVKIIIDAFERGVFEYAGRPRIDINYDSETYGLTDKEMQMFRKLFTYGNPKKLWNALMDADEVNHAKLLNDLKLKQNVLNERINIKTGPEREGLVNLVNTIEDILDSIQGYKSTHDSKISDLKSEESAKEEKGLKILTPSQMLNRLPISLA